MTSLARDDYDLIIGVGFAQGDALGKVAQRFPKSKFAIIDVDQAFVPGKPANVQGLLFREEEVGYLVGYLAGLTEKRRSGPDVISAVGGMKEPPVDRFIAGYKAGAQKAAPGLKMLLDYSQDWDDQAKCKELALNQIARGSGIVFQVAGGCGLGALNAAGERDRWGIGVDADQSALGDHILTSAKKGVDAAVFLTVSPCWTVTSQGGGNATFGLEEEGVGLGTVSPDVPQEDLEQVEQDRAADRRRRDRGHPDRGERPLSPMTTLTEAQGRFLQEPNYGIVAALRADGPAAPDRSLGRRARRAQPEHLAREAPVPAGRSARLVARHPARRTRSPRRTTAATRRPDLAEAGRRVGLA